MYEYIEQPPATIDCNPYRGGILRLQCALTAALESNVSINWYHNRTTQLTDVEQSSAENINVLKETFRSILTVTSPEPATSSGDYHCQAAVDGNNLHPSDTFTLSGDPDDVIEFMVLRDCEDSSTFFASSTKCADVSPTEPATTPTTPPPQPSQSQTTLPTTTAPSLPTTVGGAAATNSPGSTTKDDITTSNTQNNDSTGAPNTVPETLQVWIYVLVGVAAVFGIIIVILAIMCVGLCVRRSKTQDSHTIKRESECVLKSWDNPSSTFHKLS